MVLDNSGADIIELGVPYSDPLADGPVIQVPGLAKYIIMITNVVNNNNRVLIHSIKGRKAHLCCTIFLIMMRLGFNKLVMHYEGDHETFIFLCHLYTFFFLFLLSG